MYGIFLVILEVFFSLLFHIESIASYAQELIIRRRRRQSRRRRREMEYG